jgi:thiamine biosynthesis lipoprotein ApbE
MERYAYPNLHVGAFDISYAPWTKFGSLTLRTNATSGENKKIGMYHKKVILDPDNSTIFFRGGRHEIGLVAAGQGYIADKIKKVY